MRIRAVIVFVVIALSVMFFYGAGGKSNTRSAQDPGTLSAPQFVKAEAFAVSPSVSSIAVPQAHVRPTDGSKIPVKEISEPDEGGEEASETANTHDDDGAPAELSSVTMPTPELSFDGLSNFDNIDAYNLLIIPPDANGDVGPSHYVQAVNSLVRVFDKNGQPSTAPFKLSSLFAPLATPCASRNDGDASVVYDVLADRWVLTQYCTAFPPFRQMIAVSKTGDPAGQYYLYEFVMPNVHLNDYAKLGVWPDGYYMSTDEYYGADYIGSGAFAFDRRRMLAGEPDAGYIYFHLPFIVPLRVGGILPSDLDGLNAPPTGAANVFASYSANEYGEAADAVRLFDFHADFAEPGRSTLRERVESPLTVAAFDPTSPPDRMDVSQPPPGTALDAVSDRLMYRVAYRNFGDHESLVFNQTVRMSTQGEAYRAGVRVYELKRTPGAPFAVAEQSTIGDSASSRWTASAAEDNRGNLAVEYSLASDEKKPSILYTGKLAGDAPGQFRSEATLAAGTGVQKAFGNRWGDYSDISVDSEDDCTFWMTNEYFTLESETFNDFAWLTRIGKFKFPECTPAVKAAITGTVTDAASGQPIENAIVTAGAYTRTTDHAGSYGSLTAVPGTYDVAVAATGYRKQHASITMGGGQTMVRNFALTPIPIVEIARANVVAESCAVNRAVEPGEMVSVAVGLKNTGRAPINDLTATLEAEGGVTRPSGLANYGSLPADGSVVSRTFSFTVSPNVVCGRDVTLTLKLTSGSEPLGSVTLPLKAGEVKYDLRESFDNVRPPAIPRGWLTSASGAGVAWATSGRRSSSAPNSLFSLDPNQIGVNEITSPSVRITSTTAQLSFRNWYDLETTFLRNRLFDGSVLEISVDGGAWQDIAAAGGVFETGGYDEGVIDSCCQNPLAGHAGWSGRSGVKAVSEFVTSSVRLPASLAGHNVRFRWRVGTDIGTSREGQYLDDVTVTDGFSCSCAGVAGRRAPFDFDGDGRTDLSVFRPNDVAGAPDYLIENSSDGSRTSVSWGSSGDVAADADFDGNGRTDIAVFRPATGIWYVLRSSDQSLSAVQFGSAGDRPMPFDYDGDGRADVAVYRPSAGIWYWLRSSDGQFSARQFGLGDDIPVPGDYDGDGTSDIAVFRPSTGVWYVSRSSDDGTSIVRFGQADDRPVAGDFDGDGKTDIAVFRPAAGTWYMLQSEAGFGAVRFGQDGDIPLQADIDGDGRNDVAVFRPSTATWYYIRSSDGAVGIKQFGSAGDVPVPSIFAGP